MTRYIIFLAVLVSVSYSQVRYKTNTYSWVTGIDDEYNNRTTSLSFGFTSNIGEIVYKHTPDFSQSVFIPELQISYNDFYTFEENNPHNFLSYNGLKFFIGDINTHHKEGKLNPEGFRYGLGLTKGFGYNFDFLKIIPFNRSATIWQQYEIDVPGIDLSNTNIESRTYSGKNREAGVMFIFDYGVELDVSYSHTSFSSESNFGKSLVSSILELGSTRLLSYGLQELFSDSKLFPVIDFLAEFGLRTLFISLRRDKYFYPFAGKEDFTISTFNFGIKKSFNINLF